MNSEARDGVEQLFDQYKNEVFRYALYLLKNRDDAQDVVQEVFLRAYKSWDRFREESSHRTWLFRIAHNYIHDIIRRKKTQYRYLKDLGSELRVSRTLESKLEMLDLISTLSIQHQQVLLLRFVEDLSAEDIARIFGWTAAKVRTIQHRALKQLRMAVDDNGAEMQMGGDSSGH
ncbi:RNA polymerase sigma factor [Alicyclobacillus cycloheptanicus]|uniref:RNA polymerase sigma factor n=1 Tax=Alicyclobacillus cycloheptanicus TaxID=1457 RepID=A0ABT9XIG8_9BACL|nr:RNA polymerase sigma factor [Alicyclobacillus cycloheptanicus]MDQ0189814.1 RNA polymerase sigma-70 factor (ECF subfamily) [Alicyclobacillus cycloheptanicus]WDM02497.1 RNA polymerase sigma factor [Alicyclobacillus cycloheptanicus]